MSARAEAVAGPLWARLPRGPRAIGMLGILLGALAFWLELPPLATRYEGLRNALIPVVVGMLAVAAGVWAASRGERRLGWAAVGVGILGIALGLLAIRSSGAKLDTVVVWSALLASMLRFATPLTFAAIGGMFSERAGVVNIGLEGMMLTGAFFAILAADKLESWAFGLLVAMLAGGLLALIHGFVSIHLRADQIVSGTAVNFLALGVTGYFFVDVYEGAGTPTDIPAIPDVNVPLLTQTTTVEGREEVVARDLPLLGKLPGEIFGQLNLMIWLSFALLVVASFVLFKTRIGLRVRAVGEHPRAADTVGISVYATRYGAVVTSGVLAALGGAYLSIGFTHSFTENMTAGRGLTARPPGVLRAWRRVRPFPPAPLVALSWGPADAVRR